MTLTRRRFATLAASVSMPGLALAHPGHWDHPILKAQRALVFGTGVEFQAGLSLLEDYGKRDIAPGLIQALRFTRGPRATLVDLLQAVTGEDIGDSWFDWMLWQEAATDLVPHESFYDFKRLLYLEIDHTFAPLLRPEFLDRDAMQIRMEEIIWGGVGKDGIPALDSPSMIAPAAATYLRADDLVFGIAINGDVRAYPLRIMGWHEMVNDVIGGVPVSLAYCALCGSGILFETAVAGREGPFTFGSSGLLYRSNKLMYDRQSNSLWTQFTGRPVVGPMVGRGIELAQRPVVIASWADWRAAHPATTVLSRDTGHDRDYGPGVAYRDYVNSPDLMFPARVADRRILPKDHVFGVRTAGHAKAWPLAAFAGGRVFNDAIGDLPLVLIGDAATHTVRAYERGPHVFSGPGLRSADGTVWRAGADALVHPDGTRLPRVAGHVAYWFGWTGFYGLKTELYNE